MAVALSIAFDAYLRLPSDLIQMTAVCLIPPARDTSHKVWSLLLYPEEEEARSKSAGFDERIVLSPVMSAKLSASLARLRAKALQSGAVWTFDGPQFRSQFKELFGALGFPGAVPYQVRHGGASYDAAEERRPLGEIQVRLRHTTDTTTKRTR